MHYFYRYCCWHYSVLCSFLKKKKKKKKKEKKRKKKRTE